MKDMYVPSFQRKKLQETQENWKKTIGDAYDRELGALRVQNHHRTFRHINLYPYLKVLDQEDYIEIILQVYIRNITGKTKA
jgi:hypothetical protein